MSILISTVSHSLRQSMYDILKQVSWNRKDKGFLSSTLNMSAYSETIDKIAGFLPDFERSE